MVGEIVRFKRDYGQRAGPPRQKIRLEGEGLFAQCLQHEIDHLNGELYLDRARDVRPAVTEEDEERPRRLRPNGRERINALFFGTSAFAVPSLHVTPQRRNSPASLRSPTGRPAAVRRLRRRPSKSPRCEFGLPVFEPSGWARLRRVSPRRAFDLFVLASYGRILPPALLALPRLGALNVHPSLLPKYRGATPIQTAIAQRRDRNGR